MAAMLTPMMGNLPPQGQPWAADTGCFTQPAKYTDAGYLAWLSSRLPDSERCLFATAPDVVGDAAATLAKAAPMFAPIRAAGYRVALVAQDGLEDLPVPWDDFDALFIGGTTAWKLGEAAYGLAQEAKRRGKWLHMGRVNSLRRLQVAEQFGCDSVDGTFVKWAPDHNAKRIARWFGHIDANPSLWKSA